MKKFNDTERKRKVKSLSCVRLLATPWTVAFQAPFMGFSRQGYWNGLPFPSSLKVSKNTCVSYVKGMNRCLLNSYILNLKHTVTYFK